MVPLEGGSIVLRQGRDALHRAHHRHALTQDLLEVLVGGQDHGPPPRSDGRQRQGRDDVVRLHALHGEDGIPHQLQELAQERDLRLELLGGRPALFLVLRKGLVPERRAGRVEHHGAAAGGQVLLHPGQHVHESGDRIGRGPIRGREGRHGVEGPEGQTVPIDDQKFSRLFHRLQKPPEPLSHPCNMEQGFCKGKDFLPKPQAKFLTCGRDRFCMLSTAPGGCKMRIGSIYTTTHFILHRLSQPADWGHVTLLDIMAS